jgi:hypothetical protein
MGLIRKSEDLGGVSDENKFRFIEIFLKDVKNVVNGGLDFASNLVFPSVEVVFTIANANVTITHGLTRPIRGYFVISQNAAGSVYNPSVLNNNTSVVLRSSAVMTAKIVFF